MRPGQSYYRADMGWAQAHRTQGPGPRTKAQGAAGPGPGGPQLLGPWALVPGPGFYGPEPDPCRLGNMMGPDA